MKHLTFIITLLSGLIFGFTFSMTYLGRVQTTELGIIGTATLGVLFGFLLRNLFEEVRRVK